MCLIALLVHEARVALIALVSRPRACTGMHTLLVPSQQSNGITGVLAETAFVTFYPPQPFPLFVARQPQNLRVLIEHMLFHDFPIDSNEITMVAVVRVRAVTCFAVSMPLVHEFHVRFQTNSPVLPGFLAPKTMERLDFSFVIRMILGCLSVLEILYTVRALVIIRAAAFRTLQRFAVSWYLALWTVCYTFMLCN